MRNHFDADRAAKPRLQTLGPSPLILREAAPGGGGIRSGEREPKLLFAPSRILDGECVEAKILPIVGAVGEM